MGINMGVNAAISGILLSLCVLGQLVFGNYESNNTNFIGYSSPIYETFAGDAESRQFIESPHPQLRSSFSLNSFKPITKYRPNGRIGTRMVDGSDPAQSDEHHQQDEKPPYHQFQQQQHNGLPLMMMLGSGYGNDLVLSPQAQNDDHYMHEKSKEAALKGFGFGLALGFGALSSLFGAFKVVLMSLLALALLLPLLLLLFAIPLPVITTGKMLWGAANTSSDKHGDKSYVKLQDTIEDILKKLPDLVKLHPADKVP